MPPIESTQTFINGLELLSQAQEASYGDLQKASELLLLARELVMCQPSVVSQKEHCIFVCMADAVLNSITLNRMNKSKEPENTGD